MNIFNVSVIGVGKMGGALALALSKCGYKIKHLVARSRNNAEIIAQQIDPPPQILNENQLEKIDSDVIIIAVQDAEIANVSEQLAEKLEHLPYVFHTSGAISSKVLFRLNEEGCEVASFHPLVSISESIKGAEKFQDAYFCLEGDIYAIEVGKNFVSELKGKSFLIQPKDKTLYHAAAVTACGHFVALLSTAVKMLKDCGLEQETSKEILLPLIKSTVSNLEHQTLSQALTGTFARADIETMQNHLKVLREKEPEEINQIYLQLGLQSLDLAEEQGADFNKTEKMREILKNELLQISSLNVAR